VDGTANLTQSGDITFDLGLMSDWTKTNLVVDDYTDQYYWYRSYSISNVTTEPVFEDITRHGSSRLSVYNAPLDTTPTMYVDSAGNTWIGGLPLTPSIVKTFYYKALQQCSTAATATVTSAIVPFATTVSNPYNVYSNGAWYPNSTSLVRMNWSIRTAGTLQAGRGFYIVLFQNGVAFRDIDVRVSGDNSDVPLANATYVFAPSSATNYYNLGVRRFSGNDVNLAGGNTNWWFMEKIQ
jgi:hypothetical protein